MTRSILMIFLIVLTACEAQENSMESNINSNEQLKTDEQWKAELSDEAYRVTRLKGTERAFTGAFWNTKESGEYHCVCCGEHLFSSRTKFDSGTGWPSYYACEPGVGERKDRSHGMIRTEVICNKCDAHLGHVFNDGPDPTGLRYCINSAALKFIPEKD